MAKGRGPRVTASGATGGRSIKCLLRVASSISSVSLSSYTTQYRPSVNLVTLPSKVPIPRVG